MGEGDLNDIVCATFICRKNEMYNKSFVDVIKQIGEPKILQKTI